MFSSTQSFQTTESEIVRKDYWQQTPTISRKSEINGTERKSFIPNKSIPEKSSRHPQTQTECRGQYNNNFMRAMYIYCIRYI